MGMYVNPGNENFAEVRHGKYIDKSGLIAVVNQKIGTPVRLSCISRPRRFGKSFAAQMLCAYYDKSCDSSELFRDLAIAGDSSYRQHLNQYNVLYLDITSMISEVSELGEVVPFIKAQVRKELCEAYPALEEDASFSRMLLSAVEISGSKFIAIIDEWDAVVRDRRSTANIQWEYLEFLRMLFKNSGATNKIFAAAYMTGILPIKKDGSQSAISEFREYSMIYPDEFQEYIGFSEEEVREICEESGLDFEEAKYWYDGYSFDRIRSVYNPYAVMEARRTGEFRSYWQMSSAADSLLTYINMDFDGLSKAVTELIGGVSIEVNIRKFKNDLTSLRSKDDVLTLLIHFGYLSYDNKNNMARIPNEEIRMEFADAIQDVSLSDTIRRVKESSQLLQDTIAQNEKAVAARIEKVHSEEFSPLLYNSEQALRSVVKLAYFAYKDYYIQMEELSGGTGYADIVYLPKQGKGLPALVIELKWDETAEGAIARIKSRNYPQVLAGFDSRVLLVGISYDKEDKEKKHYCRIEEYRI